MLLTSQYLNLGSWYKDEGNGEMEESSEEEGVKATVSVGLKGRKKFRAQGRMKLSVLHRPLCTRLTGLVITAHL